MKRVKKKFALAKFAIDQIFDELQRNAMSVDLFDVRRVYHEIIIIQRYLHFKQTKPKIPTNMKTVNK